MAHPFLSVGSRPPALHELWVISKQKNSYCCLSGYEVNEWHVCLRSFTTTLHKAVVSVVALLSLEWFIEGGAARHGLCGAVVVSVSGKEEGNDNWCLHLVWGAHSPRLQCFWEVFSGHWLPLAPQQLWTVPQRTQAELGQLSCQDLGVSLHSLGCLPKMLHCCSVTTEG